MVKQQPGLVIVSGETIVNRPREGCLVPTEPQDDREISLECIVESNFA